MVVSVCVHVNNVNMTSQMRPEKYGRHENSNTSENTKRTALRSPNLLTDCGPSWVQRRKNIVVRSSESSWLDTEFRAPPWICALQLTRSTLACGPVRVTTDCHRMRVRVYIDYIDKMTTTKHKGEQYAEFEYILYHYILYVITNNGVKRWWKFW